MGFGLAGPSITHVAGVGDRDMVRIRDRDRDRDRDRVGVRGRDRDRGRARIGVMVRVEVGGRVRIGCRIPAFLSFHMSRSQNKNKTFYQILAELRAAFADPVSTSVECFENWVLRECSNAYLGTAIVHRPPRDTHNAPHTFHRPPPIYLTLTTHRSLPTNIATHSLHPPPHLHPPHIFAHHPTSTHHP